MTENAQRSIELGNQFPYGSDNNPDWAESIVNGVIWELTTRAGIEECFSPVDDDVRDEIIQALADIIREGTRVVRLDDRNKLEEAQEEVNYLKALLKRKEDGDRWQRLP